MHWVSDLGNVYQAAPETLEAGPLDLEDIQEELADSVRRMLWKRAAKHYESGNIERDIDFSDVRQQLRGARGREHDRWAGTLVN
eukprot:3895846-Pyramimonas_sp.AAC.1